MSDYTVNFGITKDGSHMRDTLSIIICFTCRTSFENGANNISEMVKIIYRFCQKDQNFVLLGSSDYVLILPACGKNN